MSSAKVAQRVFTTTIGRKLVVAATGSFLVIFLITHLSGNLLLLANDGGVKFNAYGEFMATNTLIRIAEIGLFATIFGHAIYAIGLAIHNRKSRPVNYQRGPGNANASFYSRFMVYSGAITLIFLVLHLVQFFVQHRILTHEGTLYDLTVKTFENAGFAVFYIICMIFLSFHLRHGVYSIFQTLGLAVSKRVERNLKVIAWVYSLVVCGGFAMIPLYFLVKSLSA